MVRPLLNLYVFYYHLELRLEFLVQEFLLFDEVSHALRSLIRLSFAISSIVKVYIAVRTTFATRIIIIGVIESILIKEFLKISLHRVQSLGAHFLREILHQLFVVFPSFLECLKVSSLLYFESNRLIHSIHLAY